MLLEFDTRCRILDTRRESSIEYQESSLDWLLFFLVGFVADDVASPGAYGASDHS